MSWNALDALYGSSTPSGPPRFYALQDAATLAFGPWPDQAYGVEILGVIRPQPLSAANPQTTLSLYFPDLLLAACMIFMAGYQRDFGQQSDDPALAQSWGDAIREAPRLRAGRGSSEARRRLMPSMSLRLRPGVDTNRTPALNEAGVSLSNMIRFREGMVEKRGGWSSYMAGVATSAIRGLWAYQDQFFSKYVAVGATNALKVVTGGAVIDATPRTIQTNPTNGFSTTAGSTTLTITDNGYSPNPGDLVNIPIDVSIGGVAFAGTFPVSAILSKTQYQVQLPGAAASTVSNGGTVAAFTTAAGSTSVTVTQPTTATRSARSCLSASRSRSAGSRCQVPTRSRRWST